jgi:hypothetical protein
VRIVALIGALVLIAGGAVAGWVVARETEEAETITSTETATATETVVESGLPAAVDDTRRDLLAATETGDYEALRPLIPSTGFEYTFGGPVEGGPIAYWQELERTTDERPLETLAELLQMPYTLSRGIYFWPWAFTLESSADLSRHERALLFPLGSLDRLFAPGTGYIGWRAGIDAEGNWVFFVAGD